MPHTASLPIHSTSRALFEGVDESTLKVANLFSVEGWVAVVTGGGTGLGLITATALAANGAKVYITGRRLEALEEAAKLGTPKDGKGEIIPIQADASNKEDITKLRDEIAKREKHVNVLVNNHGVSLPKPELDEVGPDADAWSKHIYDGSELDVWDETYRINCSSYHFTTMAFLPLLAAAENSVAREKGNVIMIASISGIIYTSQRGQFNYNCSKAGTITLSRNLATEFARRGLGIRVNVINPGYFPSGMSVKDLNKVPEGPEREKFLKEKYAIPLGKMGTAVDYAQTIIPIMVNKYMTGAEITVDGAWTLLQAY